MKRILFAMTVIILAIYGKGASANEPMLLKRAFSGTEIIFNERVDLYEGQSSVRLASNACRLRLKAPSTGLVHIEKGATLTITRIETTPSRTTLVNGRRHEINPRLRVYFKKMRTYMSCNIDPKRPLSFDDLESDNMLTVKSPQGSSAYVFE